MAKGAQIKAVKGMNDILPGESSIWLKVEAVCAEVLSNYSYQQIRTPIPESTQLFVRSIGEDTDIVSKEMYTFDDRNGDSLTLRPEGTASTVRAGIQNGLFYNQQQRLWYTGPMFRRERPQKGRYRQFHQLGAECYGWRGPDIEAEVLSMLKLMFERLGLRDTELHINSLGDSASRFAYKEALVTYLQTHEESLDDDSKRRLTSNPLRILDSKHGEVQAVLEQAPRILDFLSEESLLHFETLQSYLRALQIPFTVNSKLVRGLDYYNDTVFEWINADFGAQATICGGGRYNGLVEQLGGQSTPGFGFGMGLERLIQTLQEQEAPLSTEADTNDVFIASAGERAREQALVIQSVLCRAGLSVLCHMGEGSLKNQFKKADKSGAAIALVIGEQEANEDTVGVKALRKTASGEQPEQHWCSQNDVLNVVTKTLKQL